MPTSGHQPPTQILARKYPDCQTSRRLPHRGPDTALSRLRFLEDLTARPLSRFPVVLAAYKWVAKRQLFVHELLHVLILASAKPSDRPAVATYQCPGPHRGGLMNTTTETPKYQTGLANPNPNARSPRAIAPVRSSCPGICFPKRIPSVVSHIRPSISPVPQPSLPPAAGELLHIRPGWNIMLRKEIP